MLWGTNGEKSLFPRVFPRGISKPTAKRTQKGPKELLKGVKWGEFFSAPENKLILEGEEFKLRIGFFFTIPACCILHNGKYMVLRKVSKKAWTKYELSTVLVRPDKPFGLAWVVGRGWMSDTGNWWYSLMPKTTGNFCSQGAGGFVLAKSKFDILR